MIIFITTELDIIKSAAVTKNKFKDGNKHTC